MTDQSRSPVHGPAEDAAAAAQLLADWRKAVAKETAALGAANASPRDADINRAYDAQTKHVRAIAREAWARPVSSPADLHLRAEIAQHLPLGELPQ
jgi:hypothetical protein